MPMDDEDHFMVRDGLKGIADAVQDPWDRDSLAKELFVLGANKIATSDLEANARWALEAADIFMKALRAHRKTTSS